MTLARVETCFDVSTAFQIFKHLIDLSEIDRPDGSQLLFERSLQSITIHLSLVEKSHYGITYQHETPSLWRLAARHP